MIPTTQAGGGMTTAHQPTGFLRTYIFSTDHKTIGIQFLFTALVMLLVGGLLAMLIRWQLGWPGALMTLADLPSLNAALNATSALLLTAGLLCIRAKQIAAHTGFMLGASTSSALFLTSYLLYHAHVGSVRFLGTGWVRPVYFTLLLSHTILAVAIVPLVLRTLFLAGHKRFTEHVTIARWTWPLWLYVSVTGILVYWLLYHANVAEACPGCKEALFDPGGLPQRLSTARGYALSIGLLLLIPFGLVGALTALIVRAHRRRLRGVQGGSDARGVLTP